MEWECFRRSDKSIDLVSAWRSCVVKEITPQQEEFVTYFLLSIEERHPIRSRQVAALALAQANMIAICAIRN